MSRRVHPIMNGEFDSSEFNSGVGEGSGYNYYENNYQEQENFNYHSNFEYGNAQNDSFNSAAAENSFTESYVGNTANYFEGGTNINFLSGTGQNSYNAYNSSSFPIVPTSPVIHQPENIGYGSQSCHEAKSNRSWISAFSSGGFANEPPLLEGNIIRFCFIKCYLCFRTWNKFLPYKR